MDICMTTDFTSNAGVSSPEVLNIEIAKALGWRIEPFAERSLHMNYCKIYDPEGIEVWYKPGKRFGTPIREIATRLPQWDSDLNRMFALWQEHCPDHIGPYEVAFTSSGPIWNIYGTLGYHEPAIAVYFPRDGETLAAFGSRVWLAETRRAKDGAQ